MNTDFVSDIINTVSVQDQRIRFAPQTGSLIEKWALSSSVDIDGALNSGDLVNEDLIDALIAESHIALIVQRNLLRPQRPALGPEVQNATGFLSTWQVTSDLPQLSAIAQRNEIAAISMAIAMKRQCTFPPVGSVTCS